MSAEQGRRSWVRRHAAFVASTVVVAALGGSVSLGYWYFVQRPIENREQQQAAQREDIRHLYEDSRRLIVEVSQRLDSGDSTDVAYGKTVLSRARRVHNRAYRLMQAGEHDEAEIAFKNAQEMMLRCQPCQGTLG